MPYRFGPTPFLPPSFTLWQATQPCCLNVPSPRPASADASSTGNGTSGAAAVARTATVPAPCCGMAIARCSYSFGCTSPLPSSPNPTKAIPATRTAAKALLTSSSLIQSLLILRVIYHGEERPASKGADRGLHPVQPLTYSADATFCGPGRDSSGKLFSILKPESTSRAQPSARRPPYPAGSRGTRASVGRGTRHSVTAPIGCHVTTRVGALCDQSVWTRGVIDAARVLVFVYGAIVWQRAVDQGDPIGDKLPVLP